SRTVIQDFNASEGDIIELGEAFLGANAYYTSLEALRDDFEADGDLDGARGTILAGGVTRGDLTAANTGVVCFALGTMIATPQGDRAVETLRVGDLVVTSDNGLQAIRWITTRHLSSVRTGLFPTLRPIRIRKDAFGAGRPERDLLVSPQHRMLVRGPDVQMMFGQTEALSHAFHLLDGHRIVQDPAPNGITYVHFLCDAHEIVFANGMPSETFHPGPMGLSTLEDAPLHDLLNLFPDLASNAPPFPLARMELKQREIALLRHSKAMRARPNRPSERRRTVRLRQARP
ncbi:MAG: Hint domain-containing protein, partial [Pseudomonadota bacterium]